MKQTRLSKGGALIKARDLLGPDAFVQGPTEKHPGFNVRLWGVLGLGPIDISHGSSWEEALERAKDSSHAQHWHNFQVAKGNEIARAKESLAKTITHLAIKKYQDFMKRLATNEQIAQNAKEESAREFEEWQAKREARFAR